MTDMLVGESALPEEVAAIRAALEGSDGVERVIHLRTLHVGPDEAARRGEDRRGSYRHGARHRQDIDDAELAVRTAVPTARYIFLEPDLYRSSP
jgi:hypothetical protein